MEMMTTLTTSAMILPLLCLALSSNNMVQRY
jgi:hypothetical protein